MAREKSFPHAQGDILGTSLFSPKIAAASRTGKSCPFLSKVFPTAEPPYESYIYTCKVLDSES